MGYYIDVEKLTLDDYRLKLESAYLPPSRMILKEKIRERFGFFKNSGIHNVKELIQLLRKKDKLAELSKMEILSEEYLTILLRELNSILPKPNKLSEFTWISENTIAKLEKAGISNTEKLYYKVLKIADRQNLSKATGINEKEILELTKLSDLSRIKWVGVTYARILYDLGTDTPLRISQGDPQKLHTEINQLIKERNLKGQIGINDVKILIDSAKDVPNEIEY